MKFRSFFWALITGTIAMFLMVIIGLGWMVSQSSINLVKGGVTSLPQVAKFMPKQTPAMISLLTNPEKLYAWREVSLPLKRRSSDRHAWQQWEKTWLEKIGFDYQRDIKPWLGDEITWGITAVDYDRDPRNGIQPGYLLGMATKNTRLAAASLANFYRQEDNVTVEEYKGAKIRFYSEGRTHPWASVVVGDFVLFANQPQVLKSALDRTQAVSLNLENSDYYSLALSKLKPNHVALAYVDVLRTSAWLDKSPPPKKFKPEELLSAAIAINPITGLVGETSLIELDDRQTSPPGVKSFLDNPELQQIFASLPFDRNNLAYINLQTGTSLLEEQIPLYKVTKLAIKSLLPHLQAVTMEKKGKQDNVNRTVVRFQLD